MKLLRSIFLTLVLLSFLLSSSMALAQGQGGAGGGGGGGNPPAGFTNPLGSNVDIVKIILKVVKFLLSLAAVLALAAVVVGGLFYIISFGNEDKAKTAKKIITYAIIGLFLMGISFAIIETVRVLLVI